MNKAWMDMARDVADTRGLPLTDNELRYVLVERTFYPYDAALVRRQLEDHFDWLYAELIASPDWREIVGFPRAIQ